MTHKTLSPTVLCMLSSLLSDKLVISKMEVDDLTHGTVREYLGHFLAVLGPYYTILQHAPWLNKHHKHKTFYNTDLRFSQKQES